MIESIRGFSPKISEDVYVASSADIIGQVTLAKGSSVWYQCVLRGDVMPIEIGEQTNVQDGTVIHGTFNKCGTKVGRRVTLGHKVMLHGCEIGDRCLIGMSATIMDKSKIPVRCIVAAGSVVVENSEFEEEGLLIMGAPARVKRRLKPEELEFLDKSADNYRLYKSWYEDKGGVRL